MFYPEPKAARCYLVVLNNAPSSLKVKKCAVENITGIVFLLRFMQEKWKSLNVYVSNQKGKKALFKIIFRLQIWISFTATGQVMKLLFFFLILDVFMENGRVILISALAFWCLTDVGVLKYKKLKSAAEHHLSVVPIKRLVPFLLGVRRAWGNVEDRRSGWSSGLSLLLQWSKTTVFRTTESFLYTSALKLPFCVISHQL